MKATERILFAFIAVLVAGSLIAATPIKSLVFQGDADANGYQITGLASPTNSSNAATVGYVTNGIATASANCATAAQGTKADTALQPGASYTNISGLGTAATNAATSYATASQGALAATALQPGASYTNISGLGTAATMNATAFAPSAPPTAITATAAVKFGAASGAGITHVLPASPAAGDRAKYYVTASGGDRTLDFDAAILRPSDSGLALPKTLAGGKTYVVLMEYNGTGWMLVSLVGGY